MLFLGGLFLTLWPLNGPFSISYSLSLLRHVCPQWGPRPPQVFGRHRPPTPGRAEQRMTRLFAWRGERISPEGEPGRVSACI